MPKNCDFNKAITFFTLIDMLQLLKFKNFNCPLKCTIVCGTVHVSFFADLSVVWCRTTTITPTISDRDTRVRP